MNSQSVSEKRQLIAIYTFTILILLAITAVDWTVTNYYNLALLEAGSIEEIQWWFVSYQFSIFIFAVSFMLFFIVAIQINYISQKLNIPVNGFHYFQFLREIPKEERLKILLPPIAFLILFLFNFEDILWFRLFYGPRMSYRIDNLFETMWWLDFHLAGWIGRIMGANGAITLSLLITSAIGYLLFTNCWYKLIQDKWLFLNLGICILYIFGIDIVFGIIGPPLPYLRITLMMILFFCSFSYIVIKNTK